MKIFNFSSLVLIILFTSCNEGFNLKKSESKKIDQVVAILENMEKISSKYQLPADFKDSLRFNISQYRNGFKAVSDSLLSTFDNPEVWNKLDLQFKMLEEINLKNIEARRFDSILNSAKSDKERQYIINQFPSKVIKSK